MEPVLLSGDQFILVSLLIQIGFMASLASLLVTTRFYKRLVMIETMRPADPYWFALSFGLCLAAGVGARVLLGYSVADLSHPGALLAGLFAGPIAGMAAGAMAGGAAALRGSGWRCHSQSFADSSVAGCVACRGRGGCAGSTRRIPT
jgi:LytS/YehU family sensor histidine kinase